MERQLFKWDGCDQQGVGSFIFYDVELIKQVGKFSVGTKFYSAYVDYDEGVLVFYNEDGTKEIGKFKLGLVVL